jgi:hypothetical protein
MTKRSTLQLEKDSMLATLVDPESPAMGGRVI